MDVELLLGLIHNIDNHRTHPLDCLDSSNESSLCIPVADALAGLLVRTAGEVVAVGAQLSQEKVIVTCSTNKENMPGYIHLLPPSGHFYSKYRMDIASIKRAMHRFACLRHKNYPQRPKI